MSANESWLRKVQALLAKAESTEYPDEAEALMAKAQSLMTRHAIDQAMLAAAQPSRGEAVTVQTVTVPGPYASAKTSLLTSVTAANHCRCISGPSRGGVVRCEVVGFPGDIDKALTLFASLSMYAVRAMLAADVPAHDTPRRFRYSFILAFAARIGDRLRAAAAAAHAAAERGAPPGRSVAVVLADRSQAVDDAVADAFPYLRRVTRRTSSAAGAAHGRTAAERAALGNAAVRSGGRALPR